MYEPGDIFACYGRDLMSRFISLETLSIVKPYLGPSHVAICLPIHNQLYWCESTSFCKRPCHFQAIQFNGCQAHLISDRLSDYKHTTIYRLKGINKLSTSEATLLGEIFKDHFLAKSYDFVGAAVSGTRLIKYLPFIPNEHLFCSELIAALYMRVGRLPRRNPTVYNPGKLIRALLQTGVSYDPRHSNI